VVNIRSALGGELVFIVPRVSKPANETVKVMPGGNGGTGVDGKELDCDTLVRFQRDKFLVALENLPRTLKI
jgi:hypothetical protein